MHAKQAAWTTAILLCAAALAGCAGSSGGALETGGPGWQIREGDFFHSYYANGDTHTDKFTWKNAGGKAGVEVREDLKGGRETVRVLDAKGATVFSRDFWVGSDGGLDYTGQGEPGEWTVVIERAQAYGQLDVHVWTVQ